MFGKDARQPHLPNIEIALGVRQCFRGATRATLLTPHRFLQANSPLSLVCSRAEPEAAFRKYVQGTQAYAVRDQRYATYLGSMLHSTGIYPPWMVGAGWRYPPMECNSYPLSLSRGGVRVVSSGVCTDSHRLENIRGLKTLYIIY